MNSEQIKSALRTLIIAGLSMLGGIAVHEKWINSEQLSSFLASPLALYIAGIVATGLWGVMNKTNAAMVASADAVPGVKGVVTTPTVEGKALASAVPSATVVPAGTAAAAQVASTTPASSGL